MPKKAKKSPRILKNPKIKDKMEKITKNIRKS